jgi:hypothetical protein
MTGSIAGCRVCPTAILGQKIHELLDAAVIDSVDDFPFQPPTVQQAGSLEVPQVPRQGRDIDRKPFRYFSDP